MHDAALLTRFWAKVDKNGPIPLLRPELGPCWQWTASLDSKGYGKIAKPGKAGMWAAHRLAYDIAIGLPADPTLSTIDHLCRNRACVNPAHLEPVTFRENVLRGESPPAEEARQTHCVAGHEFTEANTYRWSGQPTQRKCRTCRRERRRIAA